MIQQCSPHHVSQVFDIYRDDAAEMAKDMLAKFLEELQLLAQQDLTVLVEDDDVGLDADTATAVYEALNRTFGEHVLDFEARLDTPPQNYGFRLRKISFKSLTMKFKGLAGSHFLHCGHV